MSLLNTVSQFIKLSRLPDAVYPLVSLFIGAAVAQQTANRDLILLMVVVVVLNSVAMIWNDIEDRLIDRDNGRTEVASMDTKQMQQLRLSAVCLVGLSLIISSFVNVAAAVMSIVTLAVIWLYNSKPFQASRRPIASLVVLSGAGAFLPFMFGALLADVTGTTLLIGLFWWIGRASLSILKDYKDAYGDAKNNKKTFLLRFGASKVAAVSVMAFVFGYGGFICLNLTDGEIVLLPVVIASTVLLIYLRRPLFEKKASYKRFDMVFRQLLQYQLLVDVGLLIWLIL